jgi:hypothetical protein
MPKVEIDTGLIAMPIIYPKLGLDTTIKPNFSSKKRYKPIERPFKSKRGRQFWHLCSIRGQLSEKINT